LILTVSDKLSEGMFLGWLSIVVAGYAVPEAIAKLKGTDVRPTDAPPTDDVTVVTAAAPKIDRPRAPDPRP
jgi:hypothetical protein